MKQIFAIDPGTTESGFCLVDYDTMKPLQAGKVRNEDLLDILREACWRAEPEDFTLCIEMIASYGMPVGQDVFETCVWIGRFYQLAVEEYNDLDKYYADEKPSIHYVYRKDEKITLCGSMKANDANIRRALIDKYAQHDFRSGKGTKNNPDWFYGFKKDVWAAYAVAVCWKEMEG